MGMFDYVKCQYPLPEVKELNDWDIDIQKIEYQTKDMNNALNHYFINENGELWYKDQKYKWVESDDSFLKGHLELQSSEDKPANYHGILNFYCYEDIGEKDGKFYVYTSEYKAKFSDNVLVDLVVIETSIKDVTENKIKIEEFFQKYEKNKNKFYNKYFFQTETYRCVRNFILKCFYEWCRINDRIHYFLSKHL